MDEKINVIAIDGPAGSGKSTTARLVAQKLGFAYLDTGAMYRALTFKALQQCINIQNESEILSLINDTNIELRIKNRQLRIILDGDDVTQRIRSQKISLHVSTVAAYAGVRNWMAQLQRKIGEQRKVVAEGRDIGTVVFPNARLKIFLVASLEERAKRRQKDFLTEGEAINLKQIAEELKKRDHFDSTREIAPLRKAKDAIELDTSNLTIEQQVKFIVEQWNKKVSCE